MSARSRLVPVVAIGACALAILLVARSLDDRRAGPEALDDGTTEAVADTAPQTIAVPAPPPTERSATKIDGAPATAAAEPGPPAAAEPPSPGALEAIDALARAHEHAAKLPGEGRIGSIKAAAELDFLQQCVGTVLAPTNRGLEVADSRMEVADDEAKFFHAGELFIVRRGEFPVYDEARDRVADLELPRSPDFYREYEALYARATAALGAREGTR